MDQTKLALPVFIDQVVLEHTSVHLHIVCGCCHSAVARIRVAVRGTEGPAKWKILSMEKLYRPVL